jgi:hypothetical protein
MSQPESSQNVFDAKVDNLSSAFGLCGNCNGGIDDCHCTLEQLEDITKTILNRRKDLGRKLKLFNVKNESDKIIYGQMYVCFHELTNDLIKAQKTAYKDIKYHNDYKFLKIEKLESDIHDFKGHVDSLTEQKQVLIDENHWLKMHLKATNEECNRKIQILIDSKVFTDVPDEISAHFDTIGSAAGVGAGAGGGACGGFGVFGGPGSLPSSPPRHSPRSKRYAPYMSPRHIDFDSRDPRVLSGLREDHYDAAVAAAFDASNNIDDDSDSIHGGRKRGRT